MRTATTSGMGPNIVLYRSLRDMLAAYPAHGVKAAIVRRKTVDLVWAPDKTVVEIHQTVMEYCEAYDRSVAQTWLLFLQEQMKVIIIRATDVTMVVPAQDSTTRFTEMQAMFPPWVLALITPTILRVSATWATVVRRSSLKPRVKQRAARWAPVGVSFSLPPIP
jgi:hypothetical protein